MKNGKYILGIFIFMLYCCSACGCGNRNNPGFLEGETGSDCESEGIFIDTESNGTESAANGETNQVGKVQNPDLVFAGPFEIFLDCNDELTMMACGGNRCYFVTMDHNTYKFSGLFYVDMNHAVCRRIDSQFLCDLQVQNIAVDYMGNCVLFAARKNESGIIEAAKIEIIDSKGAYVEGIDLSGYFTDFGRQRFHFAVDAKNNYYIATSNMLQKYTSAGEQEFEICIEDGKTVELIYADTNDLYCTFLEDGTEYLGRLDENKTIDSVAELPYQGSSTYAMSSSDDGIVLINQGYGFYVWDGNCFGLVKTIDEIMEEFDCTNQDQFRYGCFENGYICVYENQKLSFRKGNGTNCAE